MRPTDLLIDAFERVETGAAEVVDGLSEDQLHHRPGPEANPIAWLVWHLTRVQDDHVADVAGVEQVWTAQGFAERFALPYARGDIGFGHSGEQVGQLHADADLLVAYLHATHQQTVGYLSTITADDLDRVVDERWDPPVTLGVRLMSVVGDDHQHLGQAAYLRGLLTG